VARQCAAGRDFWCRLLALGLYYKLGSWRMLESTAQAMTDSGVRILRLTAAPPIAVARRSMNWSRVWSKSSRTIPATARGG